MTLARRFKAPSAQTKIVGVIASKDDLARASRLRQLPNLFELRLDAFASEPGELHASISALRARLIITARDSREGGLARLTTSQRCHLLRDFLPTAAYVDVELRAAAAMNDLLGEAKARRILRIISVHHFQRAPTANKLDEWFEAARAFDPDVFKVAVRTDSVEELSRLVDFFERHKKHARIAAMGVGKLGRQSRRELIRRGSALAYGHLGRASVYGQLSLAELGRLVQLAPSSPRS